MNVLFRDIILTPQMALRLFSGVLDPVDVIPLIDEPLRVVDPNVVEVPKIQGIIAIETVRIDNAVR